MNANQITEAFVAILGYPPRVADLCVLDAIGTEADSVAMYIWDHHMGEPVAPTLDMVVTAVRRFA